MSTMNADQRREFIAGQPKAQLIDALSQMLLIRQFEMRAEAAYQEGKIGGFFHSYIGQEAIQTAVLQAFGPKNWFTTTYRCHALALLLGESPNSLMAELFGKATGNARGRGGSMHFFSERLLGGYGIVGGQIPIATGAAFSLKHQGNKDEVSFCFMGDGAVAQGTFHEALNLASLWDLPCIFVIENNSWGMGTAVSRAFANTKLAQDKAPGYNMHAETFSGMDYIECLNGFQRLAARMRNERRPILVEVDAERFKGHSISDPAHYRTKEELAECLKKDPILLFKRELLNHKIITEQEIETIEKEIKRRVIESLEYAENSPWPNINELETGVFSPN